MTDDLISREAAIAAITLGNTVTKLQGAIRALPAAQVSLAEMGGGDVIALVVSADYEAPSSRQEAYANGWNAALRAIAGGVK